MNIVFLDSKTIGDVPNLGCLEDFGTVQYYPTTTVDQRAERLKDQQVVITNKVVIDRAAIDRASDLRLICVAATGTDNVDIGYAEHRGIVVKNVKGYSTASVAQVTWSMILTLMQRPAYFSDYVHSGQYSQHDIFAYFEPSFHEVAGMRLGIIGLGTIGQQVAQIGRAFGAEVSYYSTSGQHDHPDYTRLSLEDLLSGSDIISIHAPLNAETENLISYEQLRQMQKHTVLINTGRGGIVSEEDLVKALDEEIISRAGVDVFTQEPIDKSHPYLRVKEASKLLLTPHLGWASVEARTRLMEGVCDNIRAFLEQK